MRRTLIDRTPRGRTRRAALIATAVLVAAGMLPAAPARADVMVTSNTTGKMIGSGQSVTRIKGNKMRADITLAEGASMSTIFDVDTGKMIMLDHKKKEATIFDVAATKGVMEKVSEKDVHVKLTPTAQTKQLAGQTCTVHDSDVRVAFAPMEGQTVEYIMSGPVCLAKNIPGQADYTRFYNTAVAKGFFFSDPRAAQAQPATAKGMASLYKAWADAGLPLSSDLTIKFGGTGPMATMMSKVGGGKMTTEVTKIDAGTIADSEFAVPAGYKTKTQ